MTEAFSRPHATRIYYLSCRHGRAGFQKRFVKGFGLPGAQTQHNLGDPVGLALQLYAFNRFGSDLPGSPNILHVWLGPDGGGSIFFASRSVKDLATEAGEVQLVLALFGELRPQLGHRVAEGLLEGICAERVAASNASVPKDSNAATGVPPKCGGGPTGKGGGTWRFKSIDSQFDRIVDWLVSGLVERLPDAPSWLALLYVPNDGGGNTGLETLPAAQPVVQIPRPPAEPPPAGRARPPLSRRVLQTVSGIFKPGVTTGSDNAHATIPLAEERFDTVSATVPSGPTPELPSGLRPPGKPHKRGHSAPPCVDRIDIETGKALSDDETQRAPEGISAGILAQGKVSWWRWGRGRRERSCSSAVAREDRCDAVAAPSASFPSTESRCYFYDGDLSGGDSDAGGSKSLDLAGFAGIVCAASRGDNAGVASSPNWAVVELPPEHWPLSRNGALGVSGGNHSSAVQRAVGVLSKRTGGETMIMVVPVASLLRPSTDGGYAQDPKEADVEAQVAACRCALDYYFEELLVLLKFVARHKSSVGAFNAR